MLLVIHFGIFYIYAVNIGHSGNAVATGDFIYSVSAVEGETCPSGMDPKEVFRDLGCDSWENQGECTYKSLVHFNISESI